MFETSLQPTHSLRPPLARYAEGDRVGLWTLMALRGQGRFGETWQACAPDGRQVAIKLSASLSPEELRSLAGLCHPAVPNLISTGSRPTPHVVMGLAIGEPLHQTLSQGPLPLGAAAAMAATLCDALATVHAAGIVHADIKPANVLYNAREPSRCWLVDFGMAGNSRGGTPAYAAPELLEGGRACPNTDVWAMGKLLAEATTGLEPAPGQPPRLPVADGHWWWKLLQAMCCADPAQRPAASAVADELAAHGYEVPAHSRELIRARGQTVPMQRPEVLQQLRRWTEQGGSLGLRGGPGSGRSRSLQYLALELQARGQNPLWMGPESGPWSAALHLYGALHPGSNEGVPEGPDVPTRAARLAERIALHLDRHSALLIDDFDRIDAPSREVVQCLAADHGLAMAIAGGELPRSLDLRAQLEPLKKAQLISMIGHLIGAEVPPEGLVEMACRQSMGSPARVVELVSGAVAVGALQRRAGHWTWDPTRADRIHATRRRVAELVDALEAQARRVISLLALHPAPLPLSELTELCELDRAQLARAVHSLSEMGLARVDSRSIRAMKGPHREYLRHRTSDLTGLHQRLLDRELARAHPSPSIICHHALGALRLQHARAHGSAAIEELAQRDPQAAAHLAEALWSAVAHPSLAGPRLRALCDAGRIDEARRFGEELCAVGQAVNPELVSAFIELARIRMSHDGQLEGARAALELARRAQGMRSPPAHLLLTEAQALSQEGRTAEVIAIVSSVASGPPPRERQALEHWLRARFLWAQSLQVAGNVAEGVRVLEQIPAEAGQGLAARSVVRAALGRLLWHAGRFREAESVLAASAQDSGLAVLDRARIANNLGAARFRNGDRPGALAAWETAVTLCERVDARLEVVRCQVNLCLGYLQSGRWERSRQAGEAALTRAQEISAHDLACLAADNLAALAIAEERYTDAVRLSGRAWQIAEEHGLTREAPEVAVRRAEVALLRQDPEAGTLCRMALDLCQRHQNNMELARSHALLAALEARSNAAIDVVEGHVDRALSPLRSIGEPGELAWARVWTSEARLMVGRVEQAAADVEKVRTYAREQGLIPLARRAEELGRRVAEKWKPSEVDDQLDELVSLAVSINSQSELAALLTEIARAAVRLLDGDRAFVLMNDPPQVASSHCVRNAFAGPPSMSVVEQAIRDGREVIAWDLGERIDLQQRASILSLDLRSVLCVPMIHGERTIGAIYVDSLTASQKRLRETARLMRFLAAMAAVAVNKHNLHQEAVEQARRAALLAERERMQSERLELMAQVEAKNTELEAMNSRLRQASVTDALTGIGNRRCFMETVAELHQRSRAEKGTYGMVLIDIDHFKRFNDQYGHIAGDRALAQVSQTLALSLRSTDRVFRYGGEEMVALVQVQDFAALAQICEHLRASVRRHPVNIGGGMLVQVSASIGAERFTGGDEDWEAVLARADEALYRSKQGGRNRWTLADGSSGSEMGDNTEIRPRLRIVS